MPQLELANGYYEIPPGKLVNVVTCLEMRQPPARPLTPFPAHLALQRFQPTQTNEFRELFKTIGQDLLWFSRLHKTDEELATLFANPDVHSYRLTQAGQPLGLLELDYTTPREAELTFFGLVPDAGGQGYGKILIDEALRQAWQRPIDRLWLHTCHFDAPQALAFYLRAGFTPFARMIEVHDDPRLQGKLPVTAAPQIPLIENR